MSIPKEPRQLMINLMYLVLTALLALNVSAEVMNAFGAIDTSLQKTNENTNKALDATRASLDELLKEDAKKKYRPILPAIDSIRAEVADFSSYMSAIQEKLIDEGGDKNGTVDDGDYVMKDGVRKKMKGLKNKDVTTRMLVQEGLGDEIEARIAQARKNISSAYNNVINDHGKTFGLKPDEIESRVKNFEDNMTLNVSEEWKESDKTSWSDYKFRQMPIAAVLPLMTQIVTDAKNAESSAVNQLAELSGGRVLEFNKFFPVINAKKGYVIRGEKFEAEVSVGTYSDQINPSDVVITINGQTKRPNKEGKVTFTETAGGIGTKTLKLGCVVNNPLTGEKSSGNSEFTYEVGERAVAVSATKMNVFYIGVTNPLAVSAAGISTNELKVNASGGGISMKPKDNKKQNFDVTVSQPGECKISVSGGGMKATTFPFRVKRIPDPVARLGKKEDGVMGNGEFRANAGIIPWLDNFDFEAKCNIQGFTLTRVPKRQDPITVVNKGGRFASDCQRLVSAAKPGDIYYFNNVKARCPGDPAGRKINSMVFNIK